MKVVVIGNLDAVLGFGLVGVHGQVVSTAEEMASALDQAVADPEAGIILVTEDAADMVRPRISKLMTQSAVPLVVEIPGPEGPQPDRSSLAEMIQRAIGVRI